MFVELIDRLRCPNPHEDSWLVAAASRTANRHLMEGTLGCPVCGAEFALVDGAVCFGDAHPFDVVHVDEGEALRAAALLAAKEGGLYLLDGGWGALADAIVGLVPVQAIVADGPSAREAGGTLRGVGEHWPLAAQSMDGIALQRASVERLRDAVRVLKTRGRLVAPADTPLPAGVQELARDDRHWVGEKVGDVVPLARARR